MPVIVTGVIPSVYVMLQGCVPVNATERLADEPIQIVEFPEITAVGKG